VKELLQNEFFENYNWELGITLISMYPTGTKEEIFSYLFFI
jgi:hypothetical protein